jgi:hypothetical protein
MLAELERLQVELGPLEEKKEELLQISTKRTNNLIWVSDGFRFSIQASLEYFRH